MPDLALIEPDPPALIVRSDRAQWRADLDNALDIYALEKAYWERQDFPAHVLRGMADAIPALTASDLHTRLSTTEDPYRAWMIHCRLTEQSIPPCLRPRLPAGNAQSDYLETAADLLWLGTRYPRHKVRNPRAGWFYAHIASGALWGGKALNFYRDMRGDNFRMSSTLGLTDEQRRQTLTMPNRSQARTRRELANRYDAIQGDLLDFAFDHRDKAGAAQPADVAGRQAECFRVFALSGGHGTDALHFLREVRGLDMSRQNLAKLVDKAHRSPHAKHVLKKG